MLCLFGVSHLNHSLMASWKRTYLNSFVNDTIADAETDEVKRVALHRAILDHLILLVEMVEESWAVVAPVALRK